MSHSSQIRFLVFAHVHYPEIWEAMASELASSIKVPFALVVTHCQADSFIAKPDTPYLSHFQTILVENRGRDVLPFLKALSADLPDIDLALKIHTKRSPHRSDGADWRASMSSSLLASDQQGLIALQLLEHERRIGLIAPAGHFLPLQGRLTVNLRLMRKMADVVLGSLPTDVETYRFPAGSMFWFRRSALAPFLKKELEQQFAAERGQLDGTAAHAAERLFALVVDSRGLIGLGMEAAKPLLAELVRKQHLSSSEIKHLVEERARTADNPFVMPLANHWRRYPLLFFLAHVAYGCLPRGVTRILRKLTQRLFQ
jgi:lipopolysaccharide biosynthesis protein